MPGRWPRGRIETALTKFRSGYIRWPKGKTRRTVISRSSLPGVVISRIVRGRTARVRRGWTAGQRFGATWPVTAGRTDRRRRVFCGYESGSRRRTTSVLTPGDLPRDLLPARFFQRANWFAFMSFSELPWSSSKVAYPGRVGEEERRWWPPLPAISTAPPAVLPPVCRPPWIFPLSFLPSTGLSSSSVAFHLPGCPLLPGQTAFREVARLLVISNVLPIDWRISDNCCDIELLWYRNK